MGQAMCKARRPQSKTKSSKKRGRGRGAADPRSIKQPRTETSNAPRVQPALALDYVNYLRSLHSSRAYHQILIIVDGQLDYNYELTGDRSNRCAVLVPELLASMVASEEQFGIKASEHCLLDLTWRPPQAQISLGGLLVLMLSAIMHSRVRGSAASYQPNGVKAASELAARVAAEIDRGGLDTSQNAAPNDNLVLRCGGLLHPKSNPAIKRLADAVLRNARDVNTQCRRGATLMMLCAEDCFMSGANLFEALNWLHTKHACDWNVQDALGNTPMHEIVDSGDAACLFLLLERQMPGIDCYVRNNKGETFMQLAKNLLHPDKTHLTRESYKDYELVQELCEGWVGHWQSGVRAALQPHLPVHCDNNKGSVLAEIVMEYIDGTGEAFDKAEKDAAVEAEIEEMLAAPVAMPSDSSS